MSNVKTLGTAEVYLPLSCGLGEGPFYEEGTGELRFLDIMKKEIHSVNLEKGPSSHRAITLEDSVGVTADIESSTDEYIVAAKQGFAIFNKKTGLRYVKKTYEDDSVMAEKMRFNDGAVDTSGRFWAGTMYDFHSGTPHSEGTVFRFDPDGTLHRMIENVCIPNGMGWSIDDSTMYVTDSRPNRTIYAYDYDSKMGSIRNRRIFFQLDPPKLGMSEDAVPDGCSMDVEGCLWVAIHSGGRVLRISPSGEILAQVHIPTLNPTCPCFAGKDLDVLYITSSGGQDDQEKFVQAGNLFCFQTSTQGRRSNKFVMSNNL